MAENKKDLKIRLPESLQAGVYSNNTMVSHTKEEFILDYMMMAPNGGTVVSRVIVSPGHLKRMIHTLQDNLNKYENHFGKVGESNFPTHNVGESG